MSALVIDEGERRLAKRAEALLFCPEGAMA